MIKANEIAGLKAELTELNVKCQSARDNEVRYALQRSRLEAERTQLLVKLIEEVTVKPIVPTVTPRQLQKQPASAIPPEEDDDGLAVPEAKHKWKPDDLPSVREMVETVLTDASPKWLRPKQITDRIRQAWWPDIPSHRAASVAWGLARIGQIEKRGNRYRLKLNRHARETTTGLGNGATG